MRVVVARREVRGEVRRAQQHIAERGEIAVVLAVDEQQVDPHRGRGLLEDIAQRNEQRDAGRPVVGPRHREVALRAVRRLIGHRTGVPVGHVEHAVARRRAEPGQDVAQGQDRSLARGVRPTLDDDRVGPLAHHGDDPIAALLGAACARDARSERQLGANVREGGIAVERRARTDRPLVTGGERRERADEKRQFHGAAGERCARRKLVTASQRRHSGRRCRHRTPADPSRP